MESPASLPKGDPPRECGVVSNITSSIGLSMISFCSRVARSAICGAFLILACVPSFAGDRERRSAQSLIHPGEIWNDTSGVPINAHGGGFLYDRGTYYWFGEFKTDGRAGNFAHVGVSCYSSKDLLHWRDRGIALHVSSDPTSDIADGSVIERPKVLYNSKTKTYVMWFHLELKDHGYRAARAAIATSKKPTGPYTYLHSFRPDDKMSRDLTLFKDSDRKAYLLTASDDNWTMHLAELNDAYTGTTGRQASVFVREHLEAPAVFKHQGKYYFVASHCTGWAPNAAYSAVADSIWGPWTPLGNPARGPNAVLTFGAQSTYVLPVAGKPGEFIFMADRWRPKNAIDGRYVWLPIKLDAQGFTIPWLDEWNLESFERQAN
jgi:hypothetical protein